MTRLAAFLLLALSGCASMHEGRRYFAEAEAQICKHCNCYMPVKYDPGAPCAVCDCGTTYAECVP